MSAAALWQPQMALCGSTNVARHESGRQWGAKTASWSDHKPLPVMPVRGPKSNHTSTRGKHITSVRRCPSSSLRGRASWLSACLAAATVAPTSASAAAAASCCQSHNNFSTQAACWLPLSFGKCGPVGWSAAVVEVSIVVVVVVLQVVTSDQDGAHGSFGIDFELPTPSRRPRHTRCVSTV